MKSTLKLIICLSLLVVFAVPAQNVYHRRSAFRAQPCATTRDAWLPPQGAGKYQIGTLGSRTYVATKFTASASYTVCQIELEMEKVGSPTFSFSVGIYSDSSDSPGTLVGTASSLVDVSTIGATQETVTFGGTLSASLTSSTVYWIVVECDTIGDTSNYINWYSKGDESPAVTANGIVRSSDGATWNSYAATVVGTFQAYSN